MDKEEAQGSGGLTPAAPDRAIAPQIGGFMRFVVGFVAEVVSRSRAAGDARVVSPILHVENT